MLKNFIHLLLLLLTTQYISAQQETYICLSINLPYFNSITSNIGLTDFELQEKDNSVILYWKRNVAIIQGTISVERSRDGQQWETIKELKTTNHHEGQYIQYDDDPYQGLSYYRLKRQIGNDVFYSNPLPLNRKRSNIEFNVSPLANENLALMVNQQLDELNITVLNSIGQKIDLSFSQSDRLNFQLNTGELKKGIYFLNIESKDSAYRETLIID